MIDSMVNTSVQSGVPIKLPVWFRQELPERIALKKMHLLSEFALNSVCQQAKCPNQSSCFKNARITFLILGKVCTRNCRFCAVDKSDNQALSLDLDEPFRIGEAVKRLGIGYAVVTSVTRDDLVDGGAGIFAKTVNIIHSIKPDKKAEVLIPDFLGSIASLKKVVDSRPEVSAHNIETVGRLYKEIRPKADYDLSLWVLSKMKKINPSSITKSSLMLGLGETEGEIINTMEDLIRVHCDILTLGQYLAPSADHYPVKEFIGIERFRQYRQIGIDLGFKSVLAGPLIRSSYQAEETYRQAMLP